MTSGAAKVPPGLLLFLIETENITRTRNVRAHVESRASSTGQFFLYVVPSE